MFVIYVLLCLEDGYALSAPHTQSFLLDFGSFSFLGLYILPNKPFLAKADLSSLFQMKQSMGPLSNYIYLLIFLEEFIVNTLLLNILP